MYGGGRGGGSLYEQYFPAGPPPPAAPARGRFSPYDPDPWRRLPPVDPYYDPYYYHDYTRDYFPRERCVIFFSFQVLSAFVC